MGIYLRAEVAGKFVEKMHIPFMDDIMPHKGRKTLSVKMCKRGEQKKVTFYAKKPSLFVLKILINRKADHFNS